MRSIVTVSATGINLSFFFFFAIAVEMQNSRYKLKVKKLTSLFRPFIEGSAGPCVGAWVVAMVGVGLG